MLSRTSSLGLGLALMAAMAVAAYAEVDPNQDTGFAPRPVVRYVMAAPRACLIDVPSWAALLPWLPGGDAENFPRAAGTVWVTPGTRVVFCLSSGSEAVWYDGTYGVIATSLEVQWKSGDSDDCSCDKCRADANDAADQTATTAKRPVVKPCPWVTLGADGAKDTRKGPSIGHADVGVTVRFRKAGIYTLRGIVRTAAEPLYLQPADKWHTRLGISADKKLPDVPAEVDRDIVAVKVVVGSGTDTGQDGKSSQDPEIVAAQTLPRDKDIQDVNDASL